MRRFTVLILIGMAPFLFIHNIYAIPPFSSQEIYDFSNVIVIGKVISVNSTFSSTHNLYEIKAEKFLKNQQNPDIIFAAGQKTVDVKLGNPVFNVNDRGLFFLMNYTMGNDNHSRIFGVYPASRLIDAEWDNCKIFEKEIPREHWFLGGTGPMPQIRQGNNTDPNNFKKGIPVTIIYDVSNLSNVRQEFTLSSKLTFGTDHKSLGSSSSVVLEPCTAYKTFEASFTPRTSGSYQFEITDSRNGGTAGNGFTIYETGVDTIESLDGKQFFVSPAYDAKIGSSDTMDFHGLKFTYPSYPNPPNPGGSVKSTITFKDGSTKNVGFVGPEPIPTLEDVSATKIRPIPVLAENNNVFAGLLNDYDGVHLLVSTDLPEGSPLKQSQPGTLPSQVSCKEGLQPVHKASNNHLVCVKPQTKQILIERGWAKPI